LKLNLGAGGKPLADFVNIDMKVPDYEDGFDWVQDDVMLLNEIEDESCDELCAFHLIEHIPEPKINMMLYLWRSKLKPGGTLTLECPDLAKCCINFLQSLTTGDDFTSQRLGIIGIYGEPNTGNPYMQHLWGWTPASLSERLSLAGFSEIYEEPQQTKPEWSNARDFRLVAIK